jgi:predicted metalloprotease with PDZ domain
MLGKETSRIIIDYMEKLLEMSPMDAFIHNTKSFCEAMEKIFGESSDAVLYYVFKSMVEDVAGTEKSRSMPTVCDRELVSFVKGLLEEKFVSK